MRRSPHSRPARRGAIELHVLHRSRPPRAAHPDAGTDALDVPYWYSHSGRVRRRSVRLTPRATHRVRGRFGLR